MKINVEYLKFMWPMRHFLITCGDSSLKVNIIAVSFCMPVSKEPPLIACAIGTDAFSTKLIQQTEEFAVNVPRSGLKKEIYYCGLHTGSEVDKFKQTGLTPKTARSLKTAVIDECYAHMECTLTDHIRTGDKNLFIGKVIEAYADEAILQSEHNPDFAQGDFPEHIYSIRFL